MNKKIGVSALVAGLACTSWASVWWQGPAGDADWNEPTNWNTGSVPPATETAKFERQALGNYYFRLTPPKEFTGVIYLGPEADSRAFSMTLALTVVDGASWTVNGVGTLIAMPGIADRIRSDFTGTIEVPAGVTFDAPAALNAAVKFTGSGHLRLGKAEQLAQAAGFTGEISLPSGVESMPASLAVLQNARFTLGDGETLRLSAATLGTTAITPMGGFATDGAWSFNGTTYADAPNPDGPSGTSYTFNKAPPSVTTEGDLLLTDDPAQIHTVFFKEHKMRLTDTWGMSFTWKPELPNPGRVTEHGWGQTWSGFFGIFLQNISAENVDMNPDMRPILAKNAKGLIIYNYRDGNAQHLEWIGDLGYNFGDSLRETTLNSVTFNRPIDFKVNCNKGVLTITMEQDGQSVTVSKDFSAAIAAAGEGVYVGFGGSSDLWANNTATIPWMKQTISNFKGWYSALNSGGWQDVADSAAFYPFTPETWLMHSFYGDGTQKSGAEAQINADGSFQIIPGENKSAGLATCRRVIDVNKPCMLSFDYRFEDCPGGNPGSAENLEFGFQQLYLEDKALNSLNRLDNGGWWGQLNNWGMGWGFNYYFWANGAIQLRRQFGWDVTPDGPAAWERRQEAHNGVLVPRPYSTAHFDVVYDANGSLRVHGSITPDNKNLPGNDVELVQTLTPVEFAQFKREMGNHCRITFAGHSSAADVPRYQQTAIKNVTFKELVDCASPTVDSVLTVPANATATVKAGALMSESISPAVTFADVVLAEGATLHVAPEGETTRVALGKVVTDGAATLAADAGTTVTLGTYVPASLSTPLVVTGTVSFDEVLTVVLSTDALKTSGRFTLLDLSAASVQKLPTTVRVVDAAGNELDAKTCKPFVRADSVGLSVKQGFCILIY